MSMSKWGDAHAHACLTARCSPVLSLIVSICFSKSVGSSQPNLVVLLADDLGFNDISWNNEAAISPNLRNLADKGWTKCKNTPSI